MLYENLLNESTETLHEFLEEYIRQSIDESWSKAELTAEIQDEQSGLTYGRYLTDGSVPKERCFGTDYRIYFIFDALRQQMSKESGHSWTKATATLIAEQSIIFSFE